MLLLLLACGGPDAPAPAEAPADPPPAYDLTDYTEDERPVASFEQAAVEEALQAAVDEALATAATPVVEGYAAAMALADAGCPTLYEVDGNSVWYDECTTEAGASFSGYGFYYVYEDADALGDGTPMDGAVLSGIGTITDPDGHTIAAGGYAGVLEGTNDDGVTVFVSVLQGSFAWDAPEAAETWLGEELRPNLTVYAAVAPAYDARYVALEGGLDGLVDLDGDPLALPTATLSGVLIADRVIGFPCAQEPTGAIALRDANGAWFSVAFDVQSDWSMTGDCDGCGTVTLNGEEVGEACADFSPWLDWEDRPW